MNCEELEEMSAFFSRRCKIYDTVHPATIDGGPESKQVPAQWLPENTGRLLDLGIGTGLELEAVFRRFPDVRVTGLDICGDMLAVLREKYPDRRLELHQASYLDYDFGSGLYDAALSVMSLHHYTPAVKTALYRRIRQALKPGGVYVECDYMLSEHEYPDPLEQENLLFAQYRRIQEEQRLDPGLEYHFDTPCAVPHQKEMLLEAGFRSAEEVWRRKNTVVLVARTPSGLNA